MRKNTVQMKSAFERHLAILRCKMAKKEPRCVLEKKELPGRPPGKVVFSADEDCVRVGMEVESPILERR